MTKVVASMTSLRKALWTLILSYAYNTRQSSIHGLTCLRSRTFIHYGISACDEHKTTPNVVHKKRWKNSKLFHKLSIVPTQADIRHRYTCNQPHTINHCFPHTETSAIICILVEREQRLVSCCRAPWSISPWRCSSASFEINHTLCLLLSLIDFCNRKQYL